MWGVMGRFAEGNGEASDLGDWMVLRTWEVRARGWECRGREGGGDGREEEAQVVILGGLP